MEHSTQLPSWNEFGIVLLTVAGVVLLAGIICFVLEWLGVGLLALGAGRQQPPETPEEYAARLQSPQLEVLQARFGAPVPEGLRRLYLDGELLEQQNFYVNGPETTGPEARYFVRRFIPADKTTLDQTARRMTAPLFPFAEDGRGHRYCVLIQAETEDAYPVYLWSPTGRKIAGDMFGNYYCVLLQPDPPDPCPVYFWDHEAGGTLEEMKIADSLDELLARPRRAGR